MPNTSFPAKASDPGRLEQKSGSLVQHRNDPLSAEQPASPEGPASPAEGAELIRAFLNIRQPDVRAAVLKLVVGLSSFNSRTE